MHNHEWLLAKFQLPFAVVLDDLQLAHAVTHRSTGVVVHLQHVRIGARAARQREALRSVAARDVRVQRAARAEARLQVRGVAAPAIVDMKVDVVRIGLSASCASALCKSVAPSASRANSFPLSRALLIEGDHTQRKALALLPH
jgi:hypothetical protein